MLTVAIGCLLTASAGAYPVGSPAWNTLVEDSYQATKAGSPDQFHEWVKDNFDPPTWANAAIGDLGRAKDKDKAISEFGQDLHRAIKRAIRKFDLDRGFEFANVVRYGERQCLLQSVLLAGLLQTIGVDAGVAMVWKSEKGEASNNGHAATLVKLPSGRFVVADCSEPYAYAKHQGLFVRSGNSYKFISPRYDADGHIEDAGKIEPLDYAFVRSQFNFYRAERAPGGLLAATPTADGLAASLTYMKLAVAQCSRNPLTVYSLGRVYMKLKQVDQAKVWFQKAKPLYETFGMVPQGLRDALLSVGIDP